MKGKEKEGVAAAGGRNGFSGPFALYRVNRVRGLSPASKANVEVDLSASFRRKDSLSLCFLCEFSALPFRQPFRLAITCSPALRAA